LDSLVRDTPAWGGWFLSKPPEVLNLTRVEAVLVSVVRLPVTVPKLSVADVVSKVHSGGSWFGTIPILISTLPVLVTLWACRENESIRAKMQSVKTLYIKNQEVRVQDTVTSTVKRSDPALVMSSQSHDAWPLI